MQELRALSVVGFSGDRDYRPVAWCSFVTRNFIIWVYITLYIRHKCSPKCFINQEQTEKQNKKKLHEIMLRSNMQKAVKRQLKLKLKG